MKKLIVCLIVLAFAAAPASANMVVDGGFEFGDTGEGGYDIYPNGTVKGAWTFKGNAASGTVLTYDSVDQTVYGMHFPEGNEACVVSENGYAGYIYQSISGFTIGQTYVISLAGMTFFTSNTLGGDVEVYNPATSSNDLTWNFDTVYGGYDTSTDEEFLYSATQFVASGTDLTLYIHSSQLHGGQFVIVDDVSITEVPEPATMCLLGLGGLLLRRKR